jgi:hypothetical protein
MHYGKITEKRGLDGSGQRPRKGFRTRFGGSWTRTNEVVRRGIYSPLQLPLCDTPKKRKQADDSAGGPKHVPES